MDESWAAERTNQIQALTAPSPCCRWSRAAPSTGQVERRSHDCKRHGTTSLFAALDVATGRVIGRCFARHRATGFRRFLAEVEAQVPADAEVHLVMDNYATHKASTVRDWLLRRPHWHVHHRPTSASPRRPMAGVPAAPDRSRCDRWLNQVERFFAALTERQIRRGVHRSLASWHDAITAFIDQHNADPKPFRWTKSADDILASIERFCHRTTPAEPDRQTSESGH